MTVLERKSCRKTHQDWMSASLNQTSLKSFLVKSLMKWCIIMDVLLQTTSTRGNTLWKETFSWVLISTSWEAVRLWNENQLMIHSESLPFDAHAWRRKPLSCFPKKRKMRSTIMEGRVWGWMRVLCNYRARPKIGVCTAIWKVGQEYDEDNEYHDEHEHDDNIEMKKIPSL